MQVNGYFRLKKDHPLVPEFKKDCVLPNPEYLNNLKMGISTKGLSPTDLLYEQEGDEILFPRGMANRLKGTEDIRDSMSYGKAVNFKERITLRPGQKSFYEKFVKGVTDLYGASAQAGCGQGKCQTLSTPVLTPEGFKTLGNILPGDMVIGRDGKPTRVLQTFRNGEKDCFRVTFSDGSFVDCDDDQLFQLKNSEAPVTLKKIRNSPPEKLEVPLCEPVDLPEKEQVFSPYLLGLLLSGGAFKEGKLYLYDKNEQAKNTAKSALLKTHKLTGLPLGNSRTLIFERLKNVSEELDKLLQDSLSSPEQLKSVGGSSSKIPYNYLFGSKSQRKALLQGALDMGGRGKANVWDFKTQSRTLARGLTFLVSSLGGTCTSFSREKTYHLRIVLPEDFSSPEGCGETPHKKIKTIEPIGKKEVGCLLVDNKDHLYLVTETCTVIHNTVVCLKVIASLQKTALVIVHKTFLVNQWIERIQEFYNIEDKDIGILSGDDIDWADKKISVALVQTLLAKDLPKEFYNYYGTICVDEEHRFGAGTFRTVIWRFPARYRLGVTATPTRNDCQEKVFFTHIGKIVSVMSDSRKQQVDVHMVKTNIPPITNERPFYDFRKKINLTKVVSFLIECESRNLQILNYLVKAAEKGRKILVLSDRRGHLETLSSLLKAYCKANEHKNINISQGYYMGGMKQEDLDISTTKDVIFGTFAMACISEEQDFIDYVTGETQKFKNLVGKSVNCITHSGKITQSGKVISSGKKECFKLTHSFGDVLATADHKVLTEKGWEEVAKLSLQSHLSLPKKLEIEQVIDTPIKTSELWLLGCFIGDGSMSQYKKGVLSFISADEDVLRNVKSILETHNMTLKKVRKYRYRVCGEGKNGKGVKTWLRHQIENLGLGVTARSKEIPQPFLLLPEQKIGSLLAGLFDTDGCVTKRGEILFSSSSQKLVTQIKFLLWRLGIFSTLYPSAENMMFVLSISRNFSEQFLKTVPLKLRRRKQRIEDSMSKGRRVTKSPTNYIPTYFTKLLFSELKRRKIRKTDIVSLLKEQKMSFSWVNHNKAAEKQSFSFLINFFQIPELAKALDYIWAKVQSIENMGEQKVVDMSVPADNSFLAGEALVHNCEGLDIPSIDTVILATPKGSVQQAVGRIVREKADKKVSKVVDMIDEISICKALSFKRLKEYKKLKYDIH